METRPQQLFWMLISQKLNTSEILSPEKVSLFWTLADQPIAALLCFEFYQFADTPLLQLSVPKSTTSIKCWTKSADSLLVTTTSYKSRLLLPTSKFSFLFWKASSSLFLQKRQQLSLSVCWGQQFGSLLWNNRSFDLDCPSWQLTKLTWAAAVQAERGFLCLLLSRESFTTSLLVDKT